MLQVIYADQIARPKGSKIERLSPARMTFDNDGIRSIEKISKNEMKNLPRKAQRFRVVIPGLIDPHTHLVFAGNRSAEWIARLNGASYQEIAKRGGGIRSSVQATREASDEVLKKLAKKRLKEMIQNACTTVEVKSGYGLDLETEIKILRVIQGLRSKNLPDLIPSFMGAHACPRGQEPSAYVDHLIEDILPRINKLAEFQDVFVEKNYFGVNESIRLLEAGKRYGLKPKVHAHEFGRTGGVEVACRVGAVSVDHLQFVNDADISRLKKSKVIPVILSGTSFFLGAKHFAPARRFWDAGLPLALASDFNPGTNPGLNLPMVGTFAAIHQQLMPEEILIAQTQNAARAVDRKDRGRLEVGLRADFVALHAERFEELYYHYGRSIVEAVYIGGKKVFGSHRF